MLSLRLALTYLRRPAITKLWEMFQRRQKPPLTKPDRVRAPTEGRCPRAPSTRPSVSPAGEAVVAAAAVTAAAVVRAAVRRHNYDPRQILFKEI